jgi:polyhydroxybutyrate depolymerase
MKKLILSIFCLLTFSITNCFAINGELPSTGQTIVYQSTFNNATRNIPVHFPPNYNNSKSYALMLVNHGNGGNATGMAHTTNYNQVADLNNFIVAYPDTDPNAGGSWDIYPLNDPHNDINYIVYLINSLKTSYPNIDPSRIYIVGYSEGAGLSQNFALCHPEIIAGFGVVAENLNANWQQITQAGGCSVNTSNPPVSAVFFHGTEDNVSPFKGGVSNGTNSDGSIKLSSYNTALSWAQLNNCSLINGKSLPPVVTLQDYLWSTFREGSTTDQKYVWPVCSNNTVVYFYAVVGGGHTWPGGYQRGQSKVLGLISQNLDASSLFWYILSQHTR